jgi:hypothetical protein
MHIVLSEIRFLVCNSERMILFLDKKALNIHVSKQLLVVAPYSCMWGDSQADVANDIFSP